MTAPARPRLNSLPLMVLMLAAVAGVAAFIAILVGAVTKQPGWEGWLSGIFGGLFTGLLIMGAGAWAGIWLATPRKKAEPDEPVKPGEVGDELAGILAELETTRHETVAQINKRAVWRVPLCAAGGGAVYILGLLNGDPFDLMDFLSLMIVPALGGYAWASLALSNRYGKLYKERVLPRLATSFGDFTWRPAVMPDIEQLVIEGLFPSGSTATADDEITGTHRGLPVSIVELKLERRSGKNTVTVFDGLLVGIELPRDTHAVTAVVADGGAFGNFKDRVLKGRERVRLEDPVFEKTYEVYGTDQIAVRALLHPAFMESLLALGRLEDFTTPLALCVNRKLLLAMPKRIGRNLFEPPSFRRPAASRETLRTLRKDIAAVLAAADAVIDLDRRFARGATHG